MVKARQSETIKRSGLAGVDRSNPKPRFYGAIKGIRDLQFQAVSNHQFFTASYGHKLGTTRLGRWVKLYRLLRIGSRLVIKMHGSSLTVWL